MEKPVKTEYGLRYQRKLDTCTACFHASPDADGKWELPETVLGQLVDIMAHAACTQKKTAGL